jgi:hypothetical protein
MATTAWLMSADEYFVLRDSAEMQARKLESIGAVDCASAGKPSSTKTRATIIACLCMIASSGSGVNGVLTN